MADALVIVLALVAGLAVGACLGYLLAKREEAKAKDQLADTFKALATDALRGNSETFIGQATQAFKTVKTEAEGDLAQRQQAIEGLIKPLNEALQRYETQIANMERARQSAYGGLDQHLKTLAQAHERLQQETGNLVKALRSPQVRGQWGEITLKRVAELAGMVEHCDFREQETVQGETGRLRPDMIIQLPAGRQIVVDAKTVLAAYLEAVEAQDDEVRRERLRQHATQVRARMDQLSAKAYWSQFAQAPEFVVLFLPGEQFLGAALEYDRTLIEEGFAKKVVIATPTTLIALLRAVAYGWRQEQLAENAQAISALGKDLFERMAVLAEYLSDVGAALNKGVTAYNKAVGSLEARVLPSARRFKDLGIGSEKDIPKLESLEQAPRPVPEVDESNQ
ncbi:MAG: recombinase RmuC [Nitrospirae bacterium 13_2_20CM_2_63_8]|nr:MAG: recombinase RmuC [Nitrospirae bacterium 13_2_20CM_2_63_8]